MDLSPLFMAVGAALAWLAGRLGEALPVLLGGAGGVILVWLLDERREKEREKRSLAGALAVVANSTGLRPCYT